MHMESNWIMGGDFNIITSLEDNYGGVRRLEPEGYILREIEEDHRLIDLKPQNGNFTWTNRRYGVQHIACHLDHFLVHENIYLTRLSLDSNILLIYGSDHWPLCLEIYVANRILPKIILFRAILAK